MANFRNCIVLFLLAFSISTFAQDVRFSYQSKIGTGNVDTVLVWARSNTTSSVSLGAVNLSWVYNSTCLTYIPGNTPAPNSYWSLFRDTWGSLLDFDQLQNIVVTYDGNNYDRRVQYGNAISFFPFPVVLPPNTQAPILVMKLWFTGSCASQVYMEDEQENGLNQIADPNGNLLTYIIENLLSNPLETLWSSVRLASTSASSAHLSWVPEKDMVAGYFSVERSSSPHFDLVDARAMIAHEQEAGISYQFEETAPLPGLSYYRIRYTDEAGAETLSRVISVHVETAELKDPIRITPNPSTGSFELNFLLSDEPVKAQVWDIQGRSVWEKDHAFQGPFQVSLPFLTAGTYQMVITQQDGQRWYKKVMIK